MSEKNCGTCGWWKRRRKQTLPSKTGGDCGAKIPDSVADSSRVYMFSHEGTTCPCWKERE